MLMLFRREVLRRGLDKPILVNNCGTIDLCDIGPNIVVYPDGVIYSGVTKADIPELVDALAAGTIVERLVLNPELRPSEHATIFTRPRSTPNRRSRLKISHSWQRARLR